MSASPIPNSILWLRYEDEIDGRNPFAGFAQLAKRLGYPIVTLGGVHPTELESPLRKIRDAAGYIITHPDAIEMPALATEVEAQVNNGKRLVALTPNKDLNFFLIHFDVAVSGTKLRTPTPAPGTPSDGSRIILEAESQSNALCRTMMHGNNEVAADAPIKIWYGRTATPFFSVPDDTLLITEKDLFEKGDIRSVACAAAWPAGKASEHRVLVLGFWCVDIPFSDGLNEIHPGIDANRQFAKNLIKWLVRTLEVPPDTKGDSLQKIHAVEVSLFDTVSRVLRKEFGGSWWYDGVPEEVRKAAAERHEEGRGAVPKEGCLDFVHLKAIVEKQWRLFETVLSRKTNSKKEVLQRLSRLNQIRNRLSHPMRLRFAPLSDEEAAFVDDEFRFCKSIASAPAFDGGPPNS